MDMLVPICALSQPYPNVHALSKPRANDVNALIRRQVDEVKRRAALRSVRQHLEARHTRRSLQSGLAAPNCTDGDLGFGSSLEGIGITDASCANVVAGFAPGLNMTDAEFCGQNMVALASGLAPQGIVWLPDPSATTIADVCAATCGCLNATSSVPETCEPDSALFAQCAECFPYFYCVSPGEADANCNSVPTHCFGCISCVPRLDTELCACVERGIADPSCMSAAITVSYPP